MSNIKTGNQRYLHLRALVESAMLLALGFILSYFKVNIGLLGGSVTLLSAVPILLIGQRHGLRWSLPAAMMFGALQMLHEFYPLPTPSLGRYMLMILLDYIAAFGAYGLSGLFRRWRWGLMAGAVLGLGLRFCAHWTVGAIIWNIGDFNPWASSAAYNASYMMPEMIITVTGTVLLCTGQHVRLLIKDRNN